MSSPKAAARATSPKVVASLTALLTPARVAASRKNGPKSRGPKSPEGKARSSGNALKRGLRAERHVVVEGESAEAFTAFEAELVEDLAPEGALQTLLTSRIARAAWRLERADRMEVELFARGMEGLSGDADLGLALIRDGNGARAFALSRHCPRRVHAGAAPAQGASGRDRAAGSATGPTYPRRPLVAAPRRPA